MIIISPYSYVDEVLEIKGVKGVAKYSDWPPLGKTEVWTIPEELRKESKPKTLFFLLKGGEEIPVWVQGKTRLKVLEACFPNVALHWNSLRTLLLTPQTSKKYYFFEFKNLDELRRLPPKALITAIPFQAAILGIDLEERERRPKKLYPISWDTSLTASQLELAFHNIRIIGEVLKC